MAFELEQLDRAGIWTMTPFDEGYPRRLVDRLGSKVPVLLHAAGDLGLLDCPGIGVVGSRDVNAGEEKWPRMLPKEQLVWGFR